MSENLSLMVQLAILILMSSICTGYQLRSHKFSPSVSKQLSTAIKNKIISNLSSFSDQQFASDLESDLNQYKDSQRKLKSISVKSVNQLFSIFKIQGIQCDKNNDGIVKGDQLTCLDVIWKYYVPLDSEI